MEVLLFLVLLLVGLFIYFLPAWVASRNSHPNEVSIAVLNLLLGWTLLGWVGALVWALTQPAPAAAPVAVQPLAGAGDRVACPFCGEMVMRQAIVCRFCGRDLERQTPTGMALGLKECPGCLRNIPVADVRCRHCGTAQ